MYIQIYYVLQSAFMVSHNAVCKDVVTKQVVCTVYHALQSWVFVLQISSHYSLHRGPDGGWGIVNEWVISDIITADWMIIFSAYPHRADIVNLNQNPHP